MEHQDWNKVVWTKKPTPTKEEKVHSFNPPGTKKFRELVGDEPTAPKTISHDVKMALQKARVQKKWTQKELAAKVCLPASTICDYESGKAVPNKATLSKLGRALGIKLS